MVKYLAVVMGLWLAECSVGIADTHCPAPGFKLDASWQATDNSCTWAPTTYDGQKALCLKYKLYNETKDAVFFGASWQKSTNPTGGYMSCFYLNKEIPAVFAVTSTSVYPKPDTSGEIWQYTYPARRSMSPIHCWVTGDNQPVTKCSFKSDSAKVK